MFEYLNNFIENKIEDANLDFYTVIIGAKPSQGARSPKLWNKVYSLEQKKVQMIPLDVKAEKLADLLDYLKEDSKCLGGAVAVPFKEKMFNLIKDNIKKEIKDIGAVNCFFRLSSVNKTKEFGGTNTDGEAALEPIRALLEKNKNLVIGLLGFGGAGKAISAFLFKDFKKKHQIQIFNRTSLNINNSKNKNLEIYSLKELGKYLPHFDLLINATSVGHIENNNASPVPSKFLKKAKKTMVVYDIIYDPLKTTLLKTSEELGLKTINGLRMNLIQAVLAYRYTNQTILSMYEIYKAMK